MFSCYLGNSDTSKHQLTISQFCQDGLVSVELIREDDDSVTLLAIMTTKMNADWVVQKLECAIVQIFAASS